MSFSLKLNAKDKATGRFKSRVNRALLKAVLEAKRDKSLTQSQIARQMGVDKSIVSRILNGQGNLTLNTIGDISWAVGLRPEVSFYPIETADVAGVNHTAITQIEDDKPSGSKTGSSNSTTVYVYGSPQTNTDTSQSEGLRVGN